MNFTNERIRELYSKTTMNRMSEGPSAQSHRTNSEVLELFQYVNKLETAVNESCLFLEEANDIIKNEFDSEDDVGYLEFVTDCRRLIGRV